MSALDVYAAEQPSATEQLYGRWDRWAECSERLIPTSRFYLQGSAPPVDVQSACAECLVRVECAEEELALDVGAQYGYRGGMSARQRMALMRDRKAGLVAPDYLPPVKVSRPKPARPPKPPRRRPPSNRRFDPITFEHEGRLITLRYPECKYGHSYSDPRNVSIRYRNGRAAVYCLGCQRESDARKRAKAAAS